ncbi:CinA family protein [Robbsia betulipollinis]|uniref:CinA family protein n=1 Tax=Robbsia betulipollinis TaxID=2981849 RepID=UPI003D79A270
MPASHHLQPLAVELGETLSAAGLLLVSAESCTGGMIAAAITDIPGSSAWFERGYVTYSNEAKSTAIGVPGPLIARHGAVSEPVAKAMAEGALAASFAQIAVAVTGIAGPGGGTPAKPVGTVCFGWARHPSGAVPGHAPDRAGNGDGVARDAMVALTETRHFDGDRASIREQATLHALRGLLRWLAADRTH